jgi:pre-mRNA 3'-end-processing factor FIP1
MDDLTGDDCGDLYLDVVIQASSVINSLPNSSNLYTESESHQGNEGSDHNKVNQSEKEENLVSESKELNKEKLGVLEEVGDGSDSEDDLNIVLNDEDCKGFEVGRARNGNGNGGGGFEEEEGEGGGFVGAKNGVECNASGNGVKGIHHLPHLHYKVLSFHGNGAEMVLCVFQFRFLSLFFCRRLGVYFLDFSRNT